MFQEPGTQQAGREYLGADSHTSAPEPLNHRADKQVTSPLACVLQLPQPNSDELDWFLLPACCPDKIGDKGARERKGFVLAQGLRVSRRKAWLAECEATFCLQSESRER